MVFYHWEKLNMNELLVQRETKRKVKVIEIESKRWCSRITFVASIHLVGGGDDVNFDIIPCWDFKLKLLLCSFVIIHAFLCCLSYGGQPDTCSWISSILHNSLTFSLSSNSVFLFTINRAFIYATQFSIFLSFPQDSNTFLFVVLLDYFFGCHESTIDIFCSNLQTPKSTSRIFILVKLL